MWTTSRKWIRLFFCLLAIFIAISVLQRFSPELPGFLGRFYLETAGRDIDTTALFYTEVGHVREFTDETHGRYGSLASVESTQR